MGIFDRFKRNPESAAAASPPDPASDIRATTTADRPDFSLSLPFRWEAVSCEEGYDFRNCFLPEQIIVTVLRHNHELAAEELENAITFLVSRRRSAVGQLSSSNAILGETILTRGNGQVEARVIGEDAQNKIRLAFVIRGTAKKTVTVALTRYMLKEIGTPFIVYANVIFDLLKIKE